MTSPLVITELQNDITSHMDVCSITGALRLLRQCDAQLFSGWDTHQSINDSSFINKINRLISSLLPYFDPRGNSKTLVIMSGAGTSGRLAFQCSRALNQFVQKSNPNVNFDYLIAGSDKALIKGDERAEDNVEAAIKDVENLLQNTSYQHFIYIGITCGLSAPYVAAQIHYIINNPALDRKTTTILMGFNHASAARNKLVENWDKTVFDVVSQLHTKSQTSQHHFLLTPIVGPEPLTGSSRMKGGTMTKILIDSIFGYLIHSYGIPLVPFIDTTGHNSALTSIFSMYEIINRYTYIEEDGISRIIEIVASTLFRNGHVHYIGEDPLGLMGLIDASECPPTFGAKTTDIKGTLFGGWKTLGNKEGDLSKISPDYQISDEDFTRQLGHLTDNDLLILLTVQDQLDSVKILLKKLQEAAVKPKLIMITWRTTSKLLAGLDFYDPQFLISLQIPLPFFDLMPGFSTFLELSAKWILNAISTVAHVQIGKVLGNVMIDLQISNNKLYYRAIAMLSKLLRISEDSAQEDLLRSIYLLDKIPREIKRSPISVHISKAKTRERLMALAVLVGSGRFASVQDAKEALEREPIVSKLVQGFVAKL